MASSSRIAQTPRPPRRRPGRAGGARAKNREQRADQIGRAALALYLSRGIDAVTVDDIMRRARLAKGSFYRYFRDQTELVGVLVAPAAERLRAAFAACLEATERATGTVDMAMAYLALAQALALLVSERADIMRLYLQESRAPASGTRRPLRALADEIADRAVTLGRAASKLGVYRELDARVVTSTIVGAAERLLFEHFTRTPFAEPAAVAATVVSIILEGMGPERR